MENNQKSNNLEDIANKFLSEKANRLSVLIDLQELLKATVSAYRILDQQKLLQALKGLKSNCSTSILAAGYNIAIDGIKELITQHYND